MGQKPDDYNTVPLCRSCHDSQHRVGERTFWENYARLSGQTVHDLIEAFCKASPKAREIATAKADK